MNNGLPLFADETTGLFDVSDRRYYGYQRKLEGQFAILSDSVQSQAYKSVGKTWASRRRNIPKEISPKNLLEVVDWYEKYGRASARTEIEGSQFEELPEDWRTPGPADGDDPYPTPPQ